MPELTGEKQDTRFKPGQSGNPAGRPKGSRNKLSQSFVDALLEDFEANGKAVVQAVRAERPHEYLKVIASLSPKQIGQDEEAPFRVTFEWKKSES